MATKYTVHGVLAGAYKGRDIGKRALLLHASTDGGSTALCGKVKEHHLCDLEEDDPITCERCAALAAKL